MKIEHVNSFVASHNKAIKTVLDDAKIAGSNNWQPFVKGYDEEHNECEVAFCSGRGDTIFFIYWGFKYRVAGNDSSEVLAKHGVVRITANNAKLNIVNMRRHGWCDSDYVAQRNNITLGTAQAYFFFRENGKTPYSEAGEFVGTTNVDGFRRGFENVFRVGERKQEKKGFSGAERFNQSQFKEQLASSKQTIELLDDSGSKIREMIAGYEQYFKPITTSIDTSSAKLHENPYTNELIAELEGTCNIRIDHTKIPLERTDDDRTVLVRLRYKINYNQTTDKIEIGTTNFSTAYYGFNVRCKNSVSIDYNVSRVIPDKKDCNSQELADKLAVMCKGIKGVFDTYNLLKQNNLA